MQDFLSFINEVLWGAVLVYLIPAAGLWFTVRCGFVQLRFLGLAVKSLKINFQRGHQSITPFQALCTSLAARVGSGNLAGVTLALTAGGPGALFWMWFAAFIGMATTFAECTLAQLYKTRDRQGLFRGGPAWYMAHGLGMRWMGVVFSIFLLIAFGLVFNTVQANSIAVAMSQAFSLPPLATGAGIAICAFAVFTRGLSGIARLAQWLVPIIALLWIGASLVVVAVNIDQLPDVLMQVVRSAFGWQQAASGALGYTISQAIANGFQRGMFSNEAGMGSTPNAAAAATSEHPATQGIIQMAGVMFDTFAICTATAAIVLLAGAGSPGDHESGILLLQHALNTLPGQWGSSFVAIVLLLFAFTSIAANYAYAENNLIFLGLEKPLAIGVLRVASVLTILIGSVASLAVVWTLADIIMAFMAITNITAILLLSPVVRDVTLDFIRQKKLGITPVFDPARFPDIARQLAKEAWPSNQKPGQ